MFFFIYFQVLKKIAKYIQEQNDKVYAPRGLLLTDPIERGLRVVSFPMFRTSQTFVLLGFSFKCKIDVEKKTHSYILTRKKQPDEVGGMQLYLIKANIRSECVKVTRQDL